MTDTIREQGILALSEVLKNQQNINVLEKNLWAHSNSDSDYYIRVVYQVIGDIIKKQKINDVFSCIKKDEIGWNHHAFANEHAQMEEQDDFIEHPFEIEEGVIECRCGSKRVYSYSKQTRSADEPMTTYAECVKCNSKWQYSG